MEIKNTFFYNKKGGTWILEWKKQKFRIIPGRNRLPCDVEHPDLQILIKNSILKIEKIKQKNKNEQITKQKNELPQIDNIVITENKFKPLNDIKFTDENTVYIKKK